MDTRTDEIEYIKNILARLPVSAVHEVRDFAAYLADRERRHKDLVDRVLKAEQVSESIECSSAEEFLKAIEEAEDNNDH